MVADNERGMRSGTLLVHQIVGMAKRIVFVKKKWQQKCRA